MYSRVFLEVLEQHDGYLCKVCLCILHRSCGAFDDTCDGSSRPIVAETTVQETDPGKFTVAFRSWNAGLVWASYLKQRLALQHYPEDIIELPELAAKYSESGTLICRGVQPQVMCLQWTSKLKGTTPMYTRRKALRCYCRLDAVMESCNGRGQLLLAGQTIMVSLQIPLRASCLKPNLGRFL